MRKVLNKKEINTVLDILREEYPDAGPQLHFRNEFELLIATILSAQTTDKQVNKVTDVMFKIMPDPTDYIDKPLSEIEDMVRSIGFFRNKAKNIQKTCDILVHKYESKVPNTFEELIKLPGVGRKTANVVLSNAFGEQRIAVDTHVFRVSNRIGLVNEDNVLDTEKALMKKIPNDMWSLTHHMLIFHGRRVCKAQRPLCEECKLKETCLYRKGKD